MSKIKSLSNTALAKFNLALIDRHELETLVKRSERTSDLEFLETLPAAHASTIVRHLGQSKSQLRQDLFVLSELGFKTNGYFVEFGATNGIDLSNSYLLEKQYAWNGILAEPAEFWHADLRSNRACHIETACVWTDSTSTLSFNEVKEAHYSTINEFSSSDGHRKTRRQGKTYDVSTISLIDMLRKFHAPAVIDYLSIDTEGSEYEILKSFDFDEFSFKVITCEHNYTAMRDEIHRLLSGKGYVRKYLELSKFDDWYVLQA